MGDLGTDTAVEGADGAYRAKLSRDWEIWGPNGGYVAAVALRAAGAHSSLSRPATFACHFVGVADFDEVELAATTLRATKRAESVRVSMTQRGQPILEALVWVVAGDMEAMAHDAAPPPAVPDPAQLKGIEELISPEEREAGPPFPFWQNLESRPVEWIPNWEHREAGEPVFREWLRFRPRATFDDPFVDVARLIVLLDTFGWPAATRAYRGEDLAHIAPSIDLSVTVHRLAPDEEWLLAEGVSPVAADGLVGARAAVWSRDGRLLGSAVQQMLCRPAPPRPGAA